MRPPTRRYFEKLVYRTLYPAPSSQDPRNFDEFVRDHLVKEVRLENVRYYGPENDREEQLDALYPGHDYYSIASRRRLGQFPYHSQLFSVFDDLNLKKHEIDLLCTWEGTKSAKDRYESERGVKIADLAWDPLPKPQARRAPTVTHHLVTPPHLVTPTRRKRRVTPECPGAPPRPRQDYYENRNIWGNFNTSEALSGPSNYMQPATDYVDMVESMRNGGVPETQYYYNQNPGTTVSTPPRTPMAYTNRFTTPPQGGYMSYTAAEPQPSPGRIYPAFPSRHTRGSTPIASTQDFRYRYQYQYQPGRAQPSISRMYHELLYGSDEASHQALLYTPRNRARISQATSDALARALGN